MLGYRAIFYICCRNLKNDGEINPHFPIDPKMKVINIKNENCKIKILSKDEKNIKTPT